MDKQSAIAKVNDYLGHRQLYGRNTSFANINSSKPVWWLNINPAKFQNDLHLLLVTDKQDRLIWLKIEADTIPEPDRTFRKRSDNGAIDLEISSDPSRYLVDIKSGGSEYSFAKHIEHEWQLTEAHSITESAMPSDLRSVTDTLLFEGTKVAVQELHAYMRQDWNLYGFLHKFPSVSMEQALAEMERSARETAKRIIHSDAEIADGALVFEGSDVPVKRLFDYLADVKSLKDFHWDSPDGLQFRHL